MFCCSHRIPTRPAHSGLYHRTALWLVLAALALTTAVQADDDDTRFLLDQTHRSAEQRAQAEDTLAPPPGTLMYEGHTYQVQNQLQALEPAIYIAINSNQWTLLPDFIARYQSLSGHRPALVAMAHSLLARFQGNYPQALQQMEKARELEPQDPRIRLELARLEFENYQDQQALVGFIQALDAGLPAHAQMLVQQYQQALEKRADWHGSLALGAGYNSNINQGNGHYSCLSQLAGICLFERKMPEAIDSSVLKYELSMQRRFNLSNNHNLRLNLLSYGNYYAQTNPSDTALIYDFSQNLSVLQMGYQYLDASNSLSLAPYVEHNYRNRHSTYLAHGLELEWRHTLNRRWQFNTRLDAKRYEYTHKEQQIGRDHNQFQWGVTASYASHPNTRLYGGLTLTLQEYNIEAASNQDWSLRSGVYHAFPGPAGAFVNAMGIYRASRHDAHDAFLGERRSDQQQVYIVSVGLNGWTLAGLIPELRIRHSINRSNLDWAFGFEQSEISLMLRRHF
ncbi:surface lipoprotein assembly modifier [Nitrincola sp.]|uniref:surface lipoprotein assembly modifier n=1 Tax=Nitrincola sp. TaxID=1926584 RepID=UPI003A8DB9E8